MGRRVAVVHNPGARGDSAAMMAAAATLLEAGGAEVSSVATDMRGHGFILAADAVAEGAELVVAVGGDGTVREVAAGLAGTEVPLAIVPAGTGNSSYLELFGTRPWEETLAAALASPSSRAVDLLRVTQTGEYGLLGFSIGWFAQIVQLAATGTATGPAAYAEAAGLAAAAPLRYPATVRVDGEVLAGDELGLVAIGGARVRASVFPVFPASLMDDGLLEVLAVTATDTAGFNDLLGAVLEGRHLDHPLAHHARGRSVEITAPEGMLAEFDGDIWEREVYTVDVECAPGLLRVAGLL